MTYKKSYESYNGWKRPNKFYRRKVNETPFMSKAFFYSFDQPVYIGN